MLKLFFYLILMTVSLFASITSDFLHDVNATYDKKFYNPSHFNSSMFTFKDIDTNDTQMRIFKDFELLYNKYQKENTIFDEPYQIEIPFKLLRYYQSYGEYIVYLNNGNRDLEAEKNMHHVFAELNRMIMKSSSLSDFHMASYIYQGLLERLQKESIDFCHIMKKYHVVTEDLHFEKYQLEHLHYLNFINDRREKKLPKEFEDIDQESLDHYFTELNIEYQKYSNKYFNEMIKSFKTFDSKEKNDYDEYIQKEMNELESVWSRFRYVISVYLNYIEYRIFGEVDDFGYVAKYKGQILALGLTAINLSTSFYDYLELIKEFDEMLKNCEQ